MLKYISVTREKWSYIDFSHQGLVRRRHGLQTSKDSRQKPTETGTSAAYTGAYGLQEEEEGEEGDNMGSSHLEADAMLRKERRYCFGGITSIPAT